MKHSFYLLFFLSINACAQKTVEKPIFEHKVRTALQPSDAPPLLLLLHGYGSNEEDLFSYAQYLDERFVIVSVRAPYPHSAGNYAWYSLDFSKPPYTSNNEQAEKSRQDLGKFIDQMQEKYHTDKQKVFMLGFSQGAMMSLTCALTMPQKVKGAVVLSGKLREETKVLIADNQALKDSKIYISHGKKDLRVPFAEAENANTYLKNLGINPVFNAYPAMQHEVTEECFMAFQAWLSGVIN